MTREEIIALAKAGFTAEQIAALAQSTPAPAPTPTPTPAPAPTPTPATAPTPTPAPTQPTPDTTQQILQKLGVLTDAVRASAILNSQQPKQETADDILAAIIAPPQKTN